MQLQTLGAFALLDRVGWVGAKLNRSLSRCYTFYPSRKSPNSPISQGRWCWSFPNNLLLNFPADWPSSSTAYMLSQGDSTPGPTLERLSHQYYSAKQPLKENSFRWPSGDSNRGPSVPKPESLTTRLSSHGPVTNGLQLVLNEVQRAVSYMFDPCYAG